MAEFIETQAREGDKSEDETNDEKEEEETESDVAFIAPENTPEKSKQMSELEKMDAKLEKTARKKLKPKPKTPKAKRKLPSSSEDDGKEEEEKIYDLVIVDNKPGEDASTPSTSKSKPKKQKTDFIPPPAESSSDEDESIKVRTEMKCPISPNFFNNGYTKKDGRYFMFCKGEACCMTWFEVSSVGSYIVKAKKDVLKKFKHPNTVVRCDCEQGTKLVWLRFNDNPFLNDRLFFICKVAKKDGGKCGFVLSADEPNAINARNLAAHFDSSEKKAEKKQQQNSERLMYNVKEAEATYMAKKKKEGAKNKKK